MEPKVDFGTEISGPEQLLAMRCVPRIERAVAKTNHLVILSYYVPPVVLFFSIEGLLEDHFVPT